MTSDNYQNLLSSNQNIYRQEYQEKGEEFFLRADRGKLERQLVRRLERLGYQVILPA